MGRGSNLGELEQTVLFTLARLGRTCSARDVYAELVEVTGRDTSVAAVHVTLGRLEDKGLADVEMAEGPEGLGRDVKHFVLTSAGLDALREARARWERLWAGVGLGSQHGTS